MEKPKILIVDDDPTTCSLLETILKMQDYLTASTNTIDGESIIALLDRVSPDLLILDFHLGSKEASEYVKEIRVDDHWKDIPILITSAIDRRQDCLKAGANNFILKPFNWQEITKSIDQIRTSSINKEV
jgi:DNA-binding response OmpR family regulator